MRNESDWRMDGVLIIKKRQAVLVLSRFSFPFLSSLLLSALSVCTQNLYHEIPYTFRPILFSGLSRRSLVKKMSSSKVRNPDAANGAKVCQAQAPSIDVNNPHNQQQQQQQHKKKARRRLHTSRPYQDRLLNMAEARKEIVTALKFHRASMKQQQQFVQPAAAAPPDLEANSIFSSNLVDKSLPFTCDFEANLPPPAGHNSSFSFPLPNQTLGLNLNFQNFTNFNISSSITTEEIHSDLHNGAFFVSQPVNIAVMDTSACCSNPAESSTGEDDNLLFTEIPSWLNPTDCYLQQHLNSPCPHDSSPDQPLPWMDIEEIEGMDGDWLA